MRVAVIDYGAGNVKSVLIALERLGVSGFLTADAAAIQAADRVVFPGQGTAAMALEKLKASGLDHLLLELKQPVLGICLGLQLFFDYTDEGNIQGLGLIPGRVKRFQAPLKIPQMGWNTLSGLKGSLFDGIEEGIHMYLVHSYFAPLVPETIGQATYGQPYTVAVQKNNFFGVQFHPEKSGPAGRRLLQNFLTLNP